jgi:hypothetical protein
MRNHIGLAMFVVAAALVYAGQAHKNRVLAALAEAAARGELPPKARFARFSAAPA